MAYLFITSLMNNLESRINLISLSVVYIYYVYVTIYHNPDHLYLIVCFQEQKNNNYILN